MNIIKAIIKIVGGLLIGISCGFMIAAVMIVLFTDTTFHEFFSKLSTIELSEGLTATAVGILSLFISVFLLIVVHEGGHLVCGLLSGYKFVSFRIFNLTLIRQNGRLHIKHFAIAGTGGQCLLSPPERPIDEIPTGWYNIGGVLANITALAVILPILWMPVSPFVHEFAVIFILTDIFIILLNGIPMQKNGISNDAYNMLLLRRDSESKRGLVFQLKSNALIQTGVRPKDMPSEWFETDSDTDYSNSLAIAIPLMKASRLIDMEKWDEAYDCFNELYSHRNQIMPLYVKEIACELAFCALVTNRIPKAQKLLDSDLTKYIDTYRKTMSSKERLRCAISLYLDNNYDNALSTYESLRDRQSQYLLQGEVASDLAIMRNLLKST